MIRTSAFALSASILLVSCSGGESGQVAPGTPTPTATPTATVTPAPTPSSTPTPAASIDQPSQFGANNYVEYIPGDSPIILTAPHGGDLQPGSVPNRTVATCPGDDVGLVNDAGTQELARQMRQTFFERHGRYPHVIINRLARVKFDANRPIDEAACGGRDAEIAFADWHRFIDQAKAQVIRDHGKGWLIDLHGHGHAEERLELGYLLTSSELDQSDSALNANTTALRRTSFATLVQGSTVPFATILRGPQSIGTLYDQLGYRALPSVREPRVAGAPYFDGGYNTARHGCGSGATALGGQSGGAICALQIEAQRPGVRDTAENRKLFSEATATVMAQFLSTYYGLDITEAPRLR
jgi:hypothetical protein